MGTAAYIVCCVLPHVCAMGTAVYIVCCVLPHVCAMGTAAYIVCCVLPHVCAMGTAAYIVCCVLPHVCAISTAAYIVEQSRAELSSEQKNAELSCNPPLRGSSPPNTLHPNISACVVDKNYLKWQENQLAMNCRKDSLIYLE